MRGIYTRHTMRGPFGRVGRGNETKRTVIARNSPVLLQTFESFKRAWSLQRQRGIMEAGSVRAAVPVETVSEEEMAWIEEAMSLASSTKSSSTSLSSATPLIRSCTQISSASWDIEESPFHRHCRTRRRALAVTDITSAEWCEMQMDLTLTHGRQKRTMAMKAGTARHAELEAEVVEQVEVDVRSREDFWAVRLVNFIMGSNQLIMDGLIRELPLIGQFDGIWIFGILDEAQVCELNGVKKPLLLDTKTRNQSSLPSEPQKRNARLQLMCYKYLWDNMRSCTFPSSSFFEYFGLRPQLPLSQGLRRHITNSGLGKKVRSLNDVIFIYNEACKSLPSIHDLLRVRYELQTDRSLLGEEEFLYEADWISIQLKWCLQYWLGKRRAQLVNEEECWKCRHCAFSNICPRYHSKDLKDKQMLSCQ